MQPIHELLERIRWDPEFGKGEFVIGYYDRVLGGIVKVGLKDVQVEPGDHFFLQALDESGECHAVPYHRVREVYRDGRLIWHRGS